VFMATIAGESTQGIHNRLVIEDASSEKGVGWIRITTIQGVNENRYITFVRAWDVVAAIGSIFGNVE
jgi:hypothetical protein